MNPEFRNLESDDIGLQCATGVDMSSRVLRVSEAAYEEIHRRALEERRTLVAVVDALLGVCGRSGAQLPSRGSRTQAGRPLVKELTYDPNSD